MNAACARQEGPTRLRRISSKLGARCAAVSGAAAGFGAATGFAARAADRNCWEERFMEQKTFNTVAGAIFAVVALAHLLRLVLGWPVVVGGWTVPMWVSWIGLVVAGGLCYLASSLAMRR